MNKKKNIKALEDLMDNLKEHELLMEEKALSNGANLEEVEDMRSNYEITQMVLERKYHALTGKYYKIRDIYNGEERTHEN